MSVKGERYFKMKLMESHGGKNSKVKEGEEERKSRRKR